jgi:hypothetical protein
VFITVYIPFFVISFYCYDWSPRTQKVFTGSMAAVNAMKLVIFADIPGWI